MTLDIKHCNPNNTHTIQTAEFIIDSGIACAIKNGVTTNWHFWNKVIGHLFRIPSLLSLSTGVCTLRLNYLSTVSTRTFIYI